MRTAARTCVALLLASSICAATAARGESRVNVPVPTTQQVGATAAMPREIAPVDAPFPMPAFKRPTFPGRTVSIVNHGAKPDAPNRAAIQAAIDAVAEAGGGTVVVPDGVWNTGRIALKSNVNLHLSDAAELHFSGELEEYLPAVFTRNEGVEVMSLGGLIYADGQDNIALTGNGKLVGPPMDSPMRKRVMNAALIETMDDTPVAQRVFDGQDGGPILLPMFVAPVRCTNVFIEGVTLERTPFWNVVPVYCDGVVIRGITVNSVGIPRGDGIDVESTRNVLIEYSTLNCGDDCFTFKAGRGVDGMRVNKPTENVVVRFCLAEKGHGGITVGSETAGMIRNLYVHDVVFDGTGTGIRFKTRRPRGGGGERITFERIRMDVSAQAVTADMLGSREYVGELADRLPAREVGKLTPAFSDVTIRDVVVGRAGQFIKLTGIPESPFRNLTIENADVRCGKLIQISDARDVTIRNASIESGGATIALLDVRGLTFDRVDFNVPGGALTADVKGPASGKIKFENCRPTRPADWETTTR